MTLADMLENQQQQRLVPHEGMVVDVSTWSAAHDYHTIHQRRHNMALHDSGIAGGLEVVAWGPPDNSVVVNPGMAIDSQGHTIIVGQPQRFQLQTSEPGIMYLILQYREVPSGDGNATPAQSLEPRYVLEAYSVQERRDLPAGAYVELARVQVSGNSSLITDAADPLAPHLNEIDLRFRKVSGPRSVQSISVGLIPLEMTSEGQILHAAGVMNLLRAINLSTPYLGEFRGSVNLSNEITDCDLLVIAGRQAFTLADQWIEVLSRFMERGGILFGEACGADRGDSMPFRQSFIELAQRLSIEIVPVERNHWLFKAHYLFAQPPDGVEGHALLVAGGGLIYSGGDYGCMWDGGGPVAPATREAIRSATEFGVNLGAYASGSVRTQSVRMAAR